MRGITRREFGKMGSVALAAQAFPRMPWDFQLEIGPTWVEASPKHIFRTVGYNGQVPGPLIRLREGQEYFVAVKNSSQDEELVHWHGLYLPSTVDGAMEEGTPMIASGATAQFRIQARPAGFRWYHTHTFAGKNLTKAQYGGQHGFLLIEPKDAVTRWDQEVFLGLHDWGGHAMGSDDGSMKPVYGVSTVNGKMLGFGEPIRVKRGERVMMHILNSSPTEVHWVACSGHQFEVVALDGNALAQPQLVEMLRLGPAERVSAVVEMNNPGVWVLGEVRKHIQAAGMGIVLEYESAKDKPVWRQPKALIWDYRRFASPAAANSEAERIELTFTSKFEGHGREETWLINGLSYPENSVPGKMVILKQGRLYRLMLRNRSMDDHPVHLHRHTFGVKRVDGSAELVGLKKDVVMVSAGTTAEVEFVADNPGKTLLHCHQQDHMDNGFMMVFDYEG